MRYKLFGRSGLRVSECALGAMTFGEDWGWGSSEAEARKVFDAFVEAGGNFIDTACNYTNGVSERLTGEFVAPIRDRFVVATKYTLSMHPDDPNASGNHRKNMMQTVEGSLRNMKTDYIDLLWLHAWDFLTPVEEVMRGLDDLVRSGKVLYLGISDTPAWIIAEANLLAELRGWSRFVGLQIQYSLIERTVERELLPMARARELAVTPWGILGAGVLTGKYTLDDAHSRGDWGTATLNDRNFQILDVVRGVAKEVEATPSQVAVAWLCQNPRAQIIPILGARTVAQLQDNLGALHIELTAEQICRLDQVSRIELGFPHDFLAMPAVRQVVFGNMFERIDPRDRAWGQPPN